MLSWLWRAVVTWWPGLRRMTSCWQVTPGTFLAPGGLRVCWLKVCCWRCHDSEGRWWRPSWWGRRFGDSRDCRNCCCLVGSPLCPAISRNIEKIIFFAKREIRYLRSAIKTLRFWKLLTSLEQLFVIECIIYLAWDQLQNAPICRKKAHACADKKFSFVLINYRWYCIRSSLTSAILVWDVHYTYCVNC